MKTNKIYAAKIFKKDSSCFKIEEECLTLLKKKGIKNIVNLIDSGQGTIKYKNAGTKKQYLILEFAEKKDLSRYIKIVEKGFVESQAQLLFTKILDIVKEIHKNHICHRDLKAANILLDNDFNPIICDFGFSTYNSDRLTKGCGSPYYAAPEIPRENEIKRYDGFQVDVFALGVLLFNIVYGRHGFTEPYQTDKAYKYILMNKPDKFWQQQTLNPPPSTEFKDLYFAMIDPDPKKRPEITQIEKYKWIEDFKKKSDEDKKGIELQLYEEFCERENKIRLSTQKKIKRDNNNVNCSCGNEDTGEEEEGHFSDKTTLIRLCNDWKCLEFFIEIEGYLKPFQFMNDFYKKIEDEYEKNNEDENENEKDKDYNCEIKFVDDNLHFKAIFTIDQDDIGEENNEKINNELLFD
jgi:serine/threonine protein kinase